MATAHELGPVTIKDALIFVSRRAEENVKRLETLEKTLEEVNGEDGGEKEFEKLQNLTSQHGEKVNNLSNRITNLEDHKKVVNSEVEKINSLREEIEKLNSLRETEVEKLNSLREEVEKLNLLRAEVEKLNSLREEFKNLEKLFQESNEVELVIKEN